MWTQLCERELISRSAEGDNDVGYWNPIKATKAIHFDEWDSIKEESFNWIRNLPDPIKLLEHLKMKGVLNDSGQLCELELQNSFNLPTEYTPYYKQIRDTLKTHCVYHSAYLHLRQCAVIDLDKSTDCSLSSAPDVVAIIISMNSQVNSASGSGCVPSTETSIHSRDMTSFSFITDHLPNSKMNESFEEKLLQNDLCATKVSGEELNCLINSLLQHVNKKYLTPTFNEASIIRDRLVQKYPSQKGVMLHCDGPFGLEVLQLVNDRSPTEHNKIWKVSEVTVSTDGPIILEVAEDTRYSDGRHVVIWQQGYHFVNIVHKSCTRQHESYMDHNYTTTLTSDQLELLLKMPELIKFCKKLGKYTICSSLSTCIQELSKFNLKHDDEKVLQNFFESKLKIDFSTFLDDFETDLSYDQHQSLYHELCQYAVLKKAKLKNKRIKQWLIDELTPSTVKMLTKGSSSYFKGKPRFRMTILNNYLRLNNISEITDVDREKELLDFLKKEEVIRTTWRTQHIPLNAKNAEEFESKKYSERIHKATFLSQGQKENLIKFLQFIICFHQNKSVIMSTLVKRRSTLLDVDTPEFTLTKLDDMIETNIREKGDVLEQFSSNQCYYVANIGEKRWSARSVTIALSIVGLGFVQLAAGVATTACGVVPLISLFCISEGVSDILYGIEGLIKGHCKLTGFLKHKAISVAISCATIGVGSFIIGVKSAPSKLSMKYGLSAVKEILTTVNATQAGAHMITDMITRSGRKVVSAGFNLLFCIAVSSTLRKFCHIMENLSSNIVNHFDILERKLMLNYRS